MGRGILWAIFSRSCHPSQRDRLLEYPVPNVPVQPIRGHDINLVAQQLFQIGQQPHWKERSPPRSNINQQIDVTLFTRIPSGNRAEDAHIAGAVLGGNA